MVTFKEMCVGLRKKGHSIGEISRITGRNKSSIYPHIASIPLSEERMSEYRKNSGLRIREFALARKGKSVREFRAFDSWTKELVLLVAHLLFDGEIKRARCVYNNRSEVLIQRVIRLMLMVYEFEPKRYFTSATGVHKVCYYNVALSAYISDKAEELLREVISFPREYKREFLRAFFDDEGCMDFRPKKNHRRIRGYQKDTRVLYLVQDLLIDLGIDARVSIPNEVVISGRSNLEKFQKEINFSSGVRINGSRSNSIWKENFEKRELLARAIASFKV